MAASVWDARLCPGARETSDLRVGEALKSSGFCQPCCKRSGAPRRIRKDEKTGEPKFLVVGTSEASTSPSPCSSCQVLA